MERGDWYYTKRETERLISLSESLGLRAGVFDWSESFEGYQNRPPVGVQIEGPSRDGSGWSIMFQGPMNNAGTFLHGYQWALDL